MKQFLFLLLLPFLMHCQTSASTPSTDVRPTIPENFRVAYVGDVGTSENGHRVLQMIRAEKSGLLVWLGDFDYIDRPDIFKEMLDKDLGDVPLFAVAGNHDVTLWPEYKVILEERLKQIKDAQCSGEIGVKMRCNYKGIVFALSGVGIFGVNHDSFLKEALAESPAYFKVCAWHKNQSAMQAGNKKDETGWEVYEACREEGAMIATGHEHSYSRSFVLSDFKDQTRADKGDGSDAVLAKGQSFAFVSGLGGQSIRGQKKVGWIPRFLGLFQSEKVESLAQPWWAKIYTSDQKALHSVLFCDYHVDKDPRKARCFLKNIDGQIVDSFTIHSQI